MKASMHSGRTGNAKHNDRSFLSGKTEQERLEALTELTTQADFEVLTYRKK